MNRSIVLLSATLTSLLVASYLSWTDSTQSSTNEPRPVTLLTAEPDQIREVRYTSKDLDLTLTQREEGKDRYLWVRSTRREEVKTVTPAKPSADEAAEADTGESTSESHGDEHSQATSGEESKAKESQLTATVNETSETKTTELEFKGGDSAKRLLDGLAPFTATRSLGQVDDDKLEEFGLAESKDRLTVIRRGREERSYVLGSTTFGGASRYVLDSQDSTVYLVAGATLRPLKNGDRSLAERQLIGAKVEQISKVRVTQGEQHQLFTHKNRDDPAKSYWEAAGTESSNETAKTWLTKLFRLRARQYVLDSDLPENVETVFAVEVSVDGGKVVKMAVLKGSAEGNSQVYDWYARSSFTHGTVSLYRGIAAELSDDVSNLTQPAE